ncbi:MAG: hypothetical protein RR931_03745 [Mucinivorans sp.]
MKIVVIKRYSSPPEAYIDAGLLRENGIKCQVNGDYATSMIGSLTDQVTLCVNLCDAIAACEMVEGAHVE